MEALVKDLVFILLAALLGGLTARLLKLPNIVGYILFGIFAAFLLPVFGISLEELVSIRPIAELGIVLLLFSIGLEITIPKLFKLGFLPLYGGLLQVASCAVIFYVILSLLNFSPSTALLLSLGFSFSSTAVIVKTLIERGERETVHGRLMLAWALVQDLIVIPVLALLPLASAPASEWAGITLTTLLSAAASIFVVFVLGRRVVPFLIHRIALVNSRELLSLAAVVFAIGTAYLTSFFGVSPSLGAFLAGVVISESQENHAVFAETRPLRDLFLVLFFVTLGFLVVPSQVISHLPLIVFLSLVVLLVKALVFFILLFFSNVRGRAAVATSLGMTQVGEFAFIIFVLGQKLNLITPEMVSVGIAITLLTIITTPLLFRSVVPVWRFLRNRSRGTIFQKFFSATSNLAEDPEKIVNHIIICGYGRVGRWVGKALEANKIPFVVIDYNRGVVKKALASGLTAIYGDPAEVEILKAAGLTSARALVVAIPDAVSRQEVISHAQTLAPQVRVIARADLDEDWQTLRLLKIKKVVQPEFEGAIAIIKDILVSLGRPKSEIAERLKNLRFSHTTHA